MKKVGEIKAKTVTYIIKYDEAKGEYRLISKWYHMGGWHTRTIAKNESLQYCVYLIADRFREGD